MSKDEPEIMAPDHYQDNEEDGRQVDTVDIQALTQLNAAEINQQIMTARAYPRSVTGFRNSMREMVTYDQATALSCLYALKRSGKLIEGPSINFAMAAIQSWGNSRSGSRIVDVGEQFVTAQGFFYDLEKNMAVAFEVMRRITTREGERFGDDMIGVTGNAAGSIALRNAILKGIPRTAWGESYQHARQLSIGKGESITVKRENMLKAFAPLNVAKEQIFGLLGVKGVDDISVEHMIEMAGILNAIKEGDTTVEREFAVENFKNPDHAIPPQPQRSEFVRPTPGPGGKGKGGEPERPAQGGGGAASTARDQPGGDTSYRDGNGQRGDDGPAPSDRLPSNETATLDQMAEWYGDMCKELETKTLMKDVHPLRDAVAEELEGDRLADWQKRCAAKIDEIKAAKRK